MLLLAEALNASTADKAADGEVKRRRGLCGRGSIH
jgi:hypothetical protein